MSPEQMVAAVSEGICPTCLGRLRPLPDGGRCGGCGDRWKLADGHVMHLSAKRLDTGR